MPKFWEATNSCFSWLDVHNARRFSIPRLRHLQREFCPLGGWKLPVMFWLSWSHWICSVFNKKFMKSFYSLLYKLNDQIMRKKQMKWCTNANEILVNGNKANEIRWKKGNITILLSQINTQISLEFNNQSQWSRLHAKAWRGDEQLFLLLDIDNVRHSGRSIPWSWHLQREFRPHGRLEASFLAQMAFVEFVQCPDVAIVSGAFLSIASGVLAGEEKPSAVCGDAMREGASEAEGRHLTDNLNGFVVFLCENLKNLN